MNWTCRGGRYGGCGREFATVAQYDRHRVNGRCLPVQEMAAEGWRLTARGWTSAAPMPPDVLRRKRGEP